MGHQFVNENINLLCQNKKRKNSQEAHEAIFPKYPINHQYQMKINAYPKIISTYLQYYFRKWNGSKILETSNSITFQKSIFLFILVKSPIFLGWK